MSGLAALCLPRPLLVLRRASAEKRRNGNADAATAGGAIAGCWLPASLSAELTDFSARRERIRSGGFVPSLAVSVTVQRDLDRWCSNPTAAGEVASVFRPHQSDFRLLNT